MRRQEKVRVRQPLRSLTVAGAGVERLRPYLDLVQDEVNVKEVRLSEDIEAFASFRLQVNARAVGPRLGGETKKVIAASKKGDWERDGDAVVVAGQRLEPGEFEWLLDAKEGVACQALPSGDMIVVLDFALDEALVQEGQARDVVRAIQQARREAGLHVSDRIRIAVDLPDGYRQAVDAFRPYVAENTLADEIQLDGELDGGGASRHATKLGETEVTFALAKVAS
jgi:isoleucyl-tRNA synthetase